MPIPDLWPEDIADDSGLIMPVAILREQAAALTKKTKGLVEADVITLTPKDFPKDKQELREAFWHQFRLVAPALDSYTINLFSVLHKINPYPLLVAVGEINSEHDSKLNNQEEFIEKLREVFSSADTKRKIQALVAQSSSYQPPRENQNP